MSAVLETRKPCKCGLPFFARGMCRKCYQASWRRGHGVRPYKSKFKQNAKHFEEELQTALRELARNKNLYDLCVGTEQRLRWRREIERIENRIVELRSKISELRSPLAYMEASR